MDTKAICLTCWLEVEMAGAPLLVGVLTGAKREAGLRELARTRARNVKPQQKTGREFQGEPGKLYHASSGTGFVVSKEGHIVTNNHVINGCNEVRVSYEGELVETKIVSRDKINDLALLKATISPKAVIPLTIKNPQLMQDILVAGYPFGTDLSSSLKITKGIVSSLAGIGDNYSWVQVDAALQPGNSGGPIFDEKVNVVAVAVAKIDLKVALEKWRVVPENTNFGIKANVLSNLLDSENISSPPPSRHDVSNETLGQTISQATFYLSCLMTAGRYSEMKAKKVLFKELVTK